MLITCHLALAHPEMLDALPTLRIQADHLIGTKTVPQQNNR
jgi:hypothetical protein